jgi:hypothetical protein
VRIKQFKDDVYNVDIYYYKIRLSNISKITKNSENIAKNCIKTTSIKVSLILKRNSIILDVKPVEIDKDISAEYMSQKKYLEKSVAMLKKNLAKDDEIHK